MSSGQSVRRRVVGRVWHLVDQPDTWTRSGTARFSYFTQVQRRFTLSNTGIRSVNGHLSYLSRPTALQYWKPSGQRFIHSQKYFGKFVPPHRILRKVYIFWLSFMVVFITAFIEEYWLRKSFSKTVPDNAALIGEKLPAKYIYGPTGSAFPSWMYQYIPIFTSCHSSAWDYVTMTKSRDPKQREEGIIKLITLDGLTDVEYHIIASALDFKTAVAVAHGGGDPRVVSRGCKLHPDKLKMCLATKFREIFGSLPESSIHVVMHNACVAALQGFKPTDEEIQERYMDETAGFESEFVSSPLRHSSEPTFLKPCLQGLLSHCRLTHQIPMILQHGVMDVLLVVSHKYRDDHQIMGLVAKIFSSLACHPCSDARFEEADLLGLIAELARDEDPKLSFPAMKTLHNLDRESVSYILPPGIYQFFPEVRCDENEALVDVVFIHGILGGAFRTWRSQDLSAAWRFTKVDSTNRYGLCESSPATWYERNCWKRNHPPSFTTFRDPIKVTSENPDEDTLENSEDTDNETEIQIGYSTTHDSAQIDVDIITKPGGGVREIPKNRELRDGRIYNFDDDEEIPVEIDIIRNPPKSPCWPRDWLPLDVPHIRVLAADFDTFITHWHPVMPIESLGRTIPERSMELIEKFIQAGVGDRPVVWIAHSAGGIITKKLLQCCEESENEDYRKIARNTKSVVFYSTPHFGSKMAGFGNKGQKVVMPTVEVEELGDAFELKEIDEAFKSLMAKYSYRVTSLGELIATGGTLGVKAKLVTIDSSDPGYGEFFGLYLDHLNICKPLSRQSFVYLKAVQVINETVVKELARKTEEQSKINDEKPVK